MPDATPNIALNVAPTVSVTVAVTQKRLKSERLNIGSRTNENDWTTNGTIKNVLGYVLHGMPNGEFCTGAIHGATVNMRQPTKSAIPIENENRTADTALRISSIVMKCRVEALQNAEWPYRLTSADITFPTRCVYSSETSRIAGSFQSASLQLKGKVKSRGLEQWVLIP